MIVFQEWILFTTKWHLFFIDHSKSCLSDIALKQLYHLSPPIKHATNVFIIIIITIIIFIRPRIFNFNVFIFRGNQIFWRWFSLFLVFLFNQLFETVNPWEAWSEKGIKFNKSQELQNWLLNTRPKRERITSYVIIIWANWYAYT